MTVYENPFIGKNNMIALKESRQLIVGDLYGFIFKTVSQNDGGLMLATDMCMAIAKDRISRHIDRVASVHESWREPISVSSYN